MMDIGTGDEVGVGNGIGDGRIISGSGRGTGTGARGIGDGFVGEILKGGGSSLGILTLPSFMKSLIRPKFFEFVKLEKRLAPEKILLKLKSPAKAKGAFKKAKLVNKNTRIKDNLFGAFIPI